MKTILRPFSISNSSDWKNVHAVVFESDDWGFCGENKNPSSSERLARLGYELRGKGSGDSYYNTLEKTEDLENLYEVLSSFSDGLGRHPVFTANFVVTNPDFERIKAGNFSEYHTIPISLGFPKSWDSGKSLRQTWRSGIEKKVWMPEFHGYSHFNYQNWLKGLRKGDKKLRDFFEEEMIASSRDYPTLSEYVTNPGTGTFASRKEQSSTVSRGCEIFRFTFGYPARSTIPPSDIWNIDTEMAFLHSNLHYVQSERTRYSSALGLFRIDFASTFNIVKSAILLLGPLTKLYRNVRLELNDDESEVLETSNYLFKIGSPVVVGTHRVNYVSGIDRNLAERGRKKLRTYLKAISEDSRTVFMTSSELYQIYTRGYSTAYYGSEVIVRNFTSSDISIPLKTQRKYLQFDLTGDRMIDDSQYRGTGKLRIRAKKTLSFVPEGP
ncbi:MAG TPA: hypothetical protein VFF30_19955 [Nitrososphaerales archaeon]|nr:hypothetical protein [Nitrososphaerales archaeon]